MTFHDLCFISADEVKYEEIISMDPDDNIGNFIEEVDQGITKYEICRDIVRKNSKKLFIYYAYRDNLIKICL